MKEKIYLLGIDVGSTTVKTVVIADGELLFSKYERHMSQVRKVTLNQLKMIHEKFGDVKFKVCITGSGGLGLAEKSKIPFVQEVQGAFLAVKKYYSDIDAIIELGGEDAKIVFITGGLEQRMNGSCAGGTGAFIDQMAALLNVDIDELDAMSLKAKKTYAIASRCGVYAKSDVQPLLNQGVDRNDVAMSIFNSVVDQTVSGLAQGRQIKGKILFLGGPLSFLKGLQKAFTDRLHLDEEHAIFPQNAKVFMAIGAATFAEKVGKPVNIEEIINKVESCDLSGNVIYGKPLFNNEEEYDNFKKSHKDFNVKYRDITTYEGNAYVGIDAGSTTTKVVVLSEENEILYKHYATNKGQPLDSILKQVKDIYKLASPKMTIKSSAVTGYGEDLIKAALHVSYGVVETIAHYKAAKFFQPKVDFIIDIGGQDIKCFKIKNNAIDSIKLNEACSSGCGSFIQTFANALNIGISDFAQAGLFAKHPVELGSRCTVFMNSSVKQAQKEGATLGDISAGLSSSIVKNAIYKVIRFKSKDDLGENIVCQGGTFLNDAILRAFERETGRQVVRPSIAGLMGAFGAALYAKENKNNAKKDFITASEAENFSYKSRGYNCNICTAHCNMTMIIFNDGRHFVSGNKCEKGEGLAAKPLNLDIIDYKYNRLTQVSIRHDSRRVKVGLPLALAMYEQLPFWSTFFTELGFQVVVSDKSTRRTYFDGQQTIPSDTVCYPAKLFHGHIENLLKKKVDFIFYPSASYNLDEGKSNNHFNCPIVAYYGELLIKNNPRLNRDNFVSTFLDLNNKKITAHNLYGDLKKYGVSIKDITDALSKGYLALDEYKKDVKNKAQEIIREARAKNKKILVIAGRPYHIDPEINHGINKLINSLDLAIISEDSIFELDDSNNKVDVLNQWTYHSRLYRAARYVTTQKDMELVQLVSFGCGIDAITSDEVRSILEAKDKFYTQLKIDEISNLGAIKIRLRSLKAAMEEKERNRENGIS
ncbi:MAG: acyl-CoA dehydratase activase [Bacilli bacterium]|nr:acyl-CoA dehydratase activase [Bacilli bacterium]